MLPLGTVLDCSISSEVGKVHIDIAGQTEGTCHSAHAFSHYQSPRSSKRTTGIPTTRLQDNKRYGEIALMSAHILRLYVCFLVKLDPLTHASLHSAPGQNACADSQSVPYLV